MAAQDTCCTVVPYFKITSGKIEQFKELCEKLVKNAESETKCLYYGFAFNGDHVFCREGYEDAEGVLVHLERVGPLLAEALEISEITQLEIHGPEGELAKLRHHLTDLNPQYFVLEYGFRR